MAGFVAYFQYIKMKTLVILVAQRIEEETKNNNLRGRRGLEEERLHEA